MLRRMVPVTYLFVVLFGERTWANEFAFAAWPRSARSTIELEGSAWASRYVLLFEWGESATKFTMNVSIDIKTSCFRSKTPNESSCRQSRLDRSSSAFRVCVHVHVPAYRWVNFGSFAKACHGKSFYSGFLLFREQQRAHKYYSLTKNQERTILPSTTSDRQTARVKRKNVCKSKAWRDGANLKAHIASRSFPREIPVRGRFFRTLFSTTFRWRIFLKPTGID